MLVFAATIFLSAFLLFQIQPLIAKVILPWFGGAPNVWSTCMLFFQVVLLGGYLYAHVVNRWIRPAWQWVVHGGLLLASLVTLQIIPGNDWKPTHHDYIALQILVILGISVGLPYFVLSATSPLIQAAFARRFVGRSPYRLFALSNFGSLLALISFPFLFEPFFASGDHARGWSAGYVLFAGLCFWALVLSRRQQSLTDPVAAAPLQASSAEPEPSISSTAGATSKRTAIPEIGWWLGLSLVPSVMLLATTNHLTHSVAVLPFLWIAPLALYLISFIICFEKPDWYRRDIWGTVMIVAMTLTVLGPDIDRGAMVLRVACYLLGLFAGCMVCHGELAAMRPESKRLTLYYLLISVGGALGGGFVVLAAPYLFVKYHELHLSFIAASGLFAWRLLASGEWTAIFRLALVGSWFLMLVCLIVTQSEPEFMKRGDLERWTLVAAMWFAALTSLIHRRAEFPWAAGEEKRVGTQTIKRLAIALVFGLLVILTVGLIGFPALTIDFGMIGAIFWIVMLAVAALLVNGQMATLLNRSHVIGGAFVVVWMVLGINHWGQQMLHTDPLVIHQSRDFFGLMSITEEKSDFEGNLRSMFNGKVLHGFQYIKPENRMRHTTYFGPFTGVGLALDHHPRRESESFKIGVIGLGTGSLAVYARPGDELVFYEIKPDCIEAAHKYFYYLSDNPAGENRTHVRDPGDARVILERELLEGRSEQFDILVIDAFSGDSPPRHLLTRESFEVYRRHTKPDGIIAFNITNGYFAFHRVVLDLAQHAGWQAEWFVYNPRSSGTDRFLYPSIWALVTNNQEFLELPIVQERKRSWDDVTPVMWRDDFGGLWQILIIQWPSWLPAGWFGK